MPLIRLTTSVAIDKDKQLDLMKKISQVTAELLEKPEPYVMVILQHDLSMFFDGSAAPCAFFEVRSVGTILAGQIKNLTGKLSEVLGQEIGVGAGRIYMNFHGVPGAMWGFDSRTFG